MKIGETFSLKIYANLFSVKISEKVFVKRVFS